MKNKLLVGALVLVGLASVAYAAFAQTLTINGTGTTTGTWDVAITDITRTSATGATDATAPSFTATSATFDVELAYPGATATYDVTVTNNGSIPAVLDTVTDLAALNASAPTFITYSVAGVTAGSTTLAASATNVVEVTVEWDPLSAPVSNSSKIATIVLDYSQAT